MTAPTGERRDPRMLGRRASDHSDGQVQWLEEHFAGLIKSGIGELKVELVEAMGLILEKALGGNIPQRVTKLENLMETHQLRTILCAVVLALILVKIASVMGWL